MNGIYPLHLVQIIIEPTLRQLSKDTSLNTANAERLVALTAFVESDGGKYLTQMGGGPALGIYQMEKNTHDDIWRNFLFYRTELADRVRSLSIDGDKSSTHFPHATEMRGNLFYATAMCRVHYYRKRQPLPNPDDPDRLRSLAQYWKDHYNTSKGKGTVEGAIRKATPFFKALESTRPIFGTTSRRDA